MPNDIDEIPDELIEYIEVKNKFYYVKRRFENRITTFGKFNSLNEACAATCILIKNKWNLSNVSNNPLVTYDGEFWIFEVKDDKLILDNKFSDFELAVEHVEINTRCNDYHNDIFRNSSKKKGYKSRFKFHENVEEVLDEKYIFEDKSGKFIVKKSKSKNSISYGEFSSFDEASAARKLLLDYHWKIKDGHEIIFFSNMYWVFGIENEFLTFRGKSESYEDALDIIVPPKREKDDFINPYMKSIEENFENVVGIRKYRTPKRKSKSSKRKSKRKKIADSNKGAKDNPKRKKNVNIGKVWSPPINHENIKNKEIRICVERCSDNVVDLSLVLDFTFFDNHIGCSVDGDEIEWENRKNVTISNFSEFQLIADTLEVNDWNLSKIKNSSSIYFYNGDYYKIHVVDDKIVFGKFFSYAAAENTILIYKNRPMLPIDYNSLGIDKRGDYYELMKFQKGEVYKTVHFRSFEEIKAIRDILIHSNWDFSIFDNYDLFYLNGLYWELACHNHIILFMGKYELIKILR